MTTHGRRTRFLVTSGFAAMLLGAIDPMEGAFLILPGSGLVALGTFLGNGERRFKIYRLWVFLLIAFGVAALAWFTIAGGVGASSETSMWWALLLLPYLIGWVMGVLGADSPRWVLWFGLVVGCWYVAIPILMSVLPAEPLPGQVRIVQVVVGLTGLSIIGGIVYRLRKTKSKIGS